MDRFVVTSLRPGAGKTTLIVGLARALNRRIGYVKPLGERLLYRKKRLWDYDAALMAALFLPGENPEEMSIGFLHSKLRFMHDETARRARLLELRDTFASGEGSFFVECGREISYGASLGLDAISVARQLDAPLVVITSGEDDTVLDDLFFLKNRIVAGGVRCLGIVLNKVGNPDEFALTHLPLIRQTGLPLLGILPDCRDLSTFSVGYLADRLFAKVLCGDDELERPVGEPFIGSMSAPAALRHPLFAEEDKLVITSGDRDDLLEAALSGRSAAVILTGNLPPRPDRVAQAARMAVPLLLVSGDTTEVVRQIDRMDALLTSRDTAKLAAIERLVRTRIDLAAFSAEPEENP